MKTDWHAMKVNVYDISTRYLAFVTGHKITDMHRSYAETETPPYVYFASLDNGPLQRLSIIRRQLELEYVALEEKGSL